MTAIPFCSIYDECEVQMSMYHSINTCLVNNKRLENKIRKNHRALTPASYRKSSEKLCKSSPVVLSDTKLKFAATKLYSSSTLDKYANKFNYSEITGISLYEYKMKIDTNTFWLPNNAHQLGGNLLSRTFTCLYVSFFSPGNRIPFFSMPFFALLFSTKSL